jgi:hypothetical protein
MKKLFFKFKKDKGFAMLFTVLIVSLMLAIGLGISDITFKQAVLSGLARDSQAAFYQADSGVECGMYYTNGPTGDQFPKGTLATEDPNNPQQAAATHQLNCGNSVATLLLDQSYTDYFVYQEQVSSGNQPCFTVIFDKSTDPTKTSISSRGFSTCQSTARQVERGLNVTY